MLNFEKIPSPQNQENFPSDSDTEKETTLEETEQTRKKGGKNLRGPKKWAVMAMSVLPLVGIGCGENEKGPEIANEKPKVGRSEKQETEFFEKSKALLREILLSWGGTGKMENGNLVVHIGGGNYYELESEDLNNLMVISEKYARKLINAEQGDPAIGRKLSLKIKGELRMMARNEITKLGLRIDYEKLPKNLKEMENNRKQATKEME